MSDQPVQLASLASGYEHMLAPIGTPVVNDLSSRLIAFDANVLLGLYRRHFASAENILRNLRRIRGQLFLPAQAQDEYWQNRDSVLQTIRASTPVRDLAEVEKVVKRAVDAAAQYDIDEAEHKRLRQLVAETFENVRTSIAGKSVTQRAADALKDPSKDAILQGLTELFEGRTGVPYSPEEHARRCAEADERFTRRQPPGYEDAAKPNGGYGDYLLWAQLISHARERGVPVLLVTDDEKEDWWRLFDRRIRINARHELVAEMRAKAGVDFMLLTLDEFLTVLSADPGATIDESAVDDAGLDGDNESTEWSFEAWTLEEFTSVVSRLMELGYTKQVRVMLEAAGVPGGVLSRAEVLDLLGLSSDAKLTGFTRPIRRVQEALIEEGQVREDLVWVLRAGYDGPGKAQRFAVPAEVALAFSSGDEKPIRVD